LPGIDDRVSRTVEWAAEAVEPGDALVRVRRKKARRRLLHRVQRSALVVVVLGALAGGLLTLVRVFGQIERVPPAAPSLRNGKIAFVALTNPGQPENYDILAVNPDGTGIEQLTDDPAPEYDPAWSPDGTKIAFAREHVDDSGDQGSMGIYVMNAAGSDVKRITTGEGVHDRSPTWSPDGSMIAFSSNRKGFSDIWVVNADGTGLRQLTDLSEKGVDYASLPTWSPDGSVIAFRRSPLEPSGELEPQGIWLVDVGSGELVQLTEGPILDEPASWSPDGRHLAFSRKIRTETAVYTEVYVANLDDGREISLTRGGDPAWSPDGTRIAFSGGHPRELGIYLMDADGSNVVRVPTPPELGSSPISSAWQPLPVSSSPITDLEGEENLPAGQPSGPLSPVEEPADIQRFEIGSEPKEITVGEGGVWVTTAEDVVRIDEASGDVVARINLAHADQAIPGGGEGIAVGLGSVWVANPVFTDHDPRFPQGTTGGVVRIDATTDRLVDFVVFTDRTPTRVAVGEGAVWVTTGETVTRLDPQTLEVEATISLGPGHANLPQIATDIAVGEGGIWVAAGVQGDYPTAIVRIDPRTNRVVAQVKPLGGTNGLAVGEGAVWATVAEPAFLLRIDPVTNTEAARVEVAEGLDAVDTGGGLVWVGYIDGRTGGVAGIDPTTGKVLRRIVLESASSDLVVGEGAVWSVGFAEPAVFRIVV
jgi:hypothetical protein